MTAARVAIVADLLEERWPSMDLMAEMLMAELGPEHSGVVPMLMRPAFRSRFSPLAGRRNGAPLLTADRIAHRFWDYPRWLRQAPRADVYHVVDHSYAHLASELPGGRVVVTCHDTDAFRTLVLPDRRESSLPRVLVRRVLRGLQRAALVVCDSATTRDELERFGLVPRDRTSVVPIGVHPSCSAQPDGANDAAAAALTGDRTGPLLLHVGSTIPRKRIDTLVALLARVASERPDVHLVRVGGKFTRSQQAKVDACGLGGRISVLPFVERPVLAALYRRSALVLLPSEREGFGLPVVEAMASATPILASDLPVLREVGGGAAAYAPVGDADTWATRVLDLLAERERDAEAWHRRRQAGLARASIFSWDRYAAAMRAIYAQIASRAS